MEPSGGGRTGSRDSNPPPVLGPLREDPVSLSFSKTLPGKEYLLLTQVSVLEALLGSGLSFLLENCPVIEKPSKYISTVYGRRLEDNLRF